MVGLSGGMGMDDAGSGHHARLFLRLFFFNCSTMRLWEIRMNEKMSYLQIWREVRVSFCKIVIVCFLSVRYKSDGLYYKMAGTPSSPTQLFTRVEMISLVTTKVKWNLSMLYK